MVLETVAKSYAWVIVLTGLLGAVLGIDRTFKSREKESKVLQVLSFFAGLLMLGFPIVMLVKVGHSVTYSNYTILIMFVLGLSLIARPLQRIPIAYLIVALLGLGMFFIILQSKDVSLAEDIPIGIWAVAILILLVLVFILSFLFEKIVDTLLAIMGWGPLVTIFSLAALAQGVVIGTGLSNKYGIFEFF